ncbi:hypothetical protein V3C99_011850 [Haemonchus contortus]
MRQKVLLLICTVIVYVEGSLTDRDYLKRTACERNPKLAICQPAEERLPLITPPPLPTEAAHEVSKWSKGSRAKDELSDLNSQLLEEYRKEKGTPVADEDLASLQAKCSRMAPVVQKYCEKKALTKGNVARCAAYFNDCKRFFGESDPLYAVANSFSSAVNLNFATIGVNGIPYYPINEEGGVGVGVTSNIPFGSWGGGYSGSVGVRDYWSQNMEAGGNWYDGKYGYKNGWSVPLVQSLGIEGGQHNVVSVPLDRRNMGKIMVDNGYGVGGYYGQNDHVGIDWKRGDVQHTFGVMSPFVGAGFNTGQAVTFPSLETFMRAGRK